MPSVFPVLRTPDDKQLKNSREDIRAPECTVFQSAVFYNGGEPGFRADPDSGGLYFVRSSMISLLLCTKAVISSGLSGLWASIARS